jgi:hypothetical protein
MQKNTKNTAPKAPPRLDNATTEKYNTETLQKDGNISIVL